MLFYTRKVLSGVYRGVEVSSGKFNEAWIFMSGSVGMLCGIMIQWLGGERQLSVIPCIIFLTEHKSRLIAFADSSELRPIEYIE